MRRENKQQGGSILPPGYTQLQYLQANGTQAIQTNLHISSEDVCRVRFIHSGNFVPISGNGIANANMVRFAMVGTTVFLDYGNDSSYRTTGGNLAYNTEHYIEYGNRYAYNLNTQGYIINATPIPNFVKTYVYCLWKTDYSAGWGSGKILEFEVVGKMHLIPALRDFDSKPGMYDIVNNVFYTNVGSNEFLYA